MIPLLKSFMSIKYFLTCLLTIKKKGAFTLSIGVKLFKIRENCAK